MADDGARGRRGGWWVIYGGVFGLLVILGVGGWMWGVRHVPAMMSDARLVEVWVEQNRSGLSGAGEFLKDWGLGTAESEAYRRVRLEGGERIFVAAVDAGAEKEAEEMLMELVIDGRLDAEVFEVAMVSGMKSVWMNALGAAGSGNIVNEDLPSTLRMVVGYSTVEDSQVRIVSMTMVLRGIQERLKYAQRSGAHLAELEWLRDEWRVMNREWEDVDEAERADWVERVVDLLDQAEG